MKSLLQDKRKMVSVVIPVYNGEKYISDCLESVYSQTYQPLEVVVVDDGSTDHSLSLIKKFPGDKKIIMQQNSDVSHARNVGVNNSSGEYIAFIDQDDMWFPEKIEKQLNVFIRNDKTDLVFTDLLKMTFSGNMRKVKNKHEIALTLTRHNLFPALVRKNLLMPSAVMVKKSSFIDAGLFDESFKTCGDYEMWLRMAALGMNFSYLPERLTIYRQHSENVSKKIEVMHSDRLKAINKVFALPELLGRFEKEKSTGLAFAYMEGAHSYFGTKQYEKFLENARRAFALDKAVVNWKFIRRYMRSWIKTHIKSK